MHVEEQALALDFDDPRLAGEKPRTDFIAQSIRGNLILGHQSGRRGGQVAHQHCPATITFGGIQRRKRCDIHQPSLSTWTRMRPPQDKPTRQAVSSATPNSSISLCRFR